MPRGSDAPMTLRDAMRTAADMAQRSASPENYRWHAVWWRLHSRESRSGDALRYSRNQLALYHDMQARQEHYARKPEGLTDWQWSGLSA